MEGVINGLALGLKNPKEELVRKEISKSHVGGFSALFVVLVGLIGALLGYILKKT